jgi:DNA-directed RNA polymerase specialized sigma24 family protein
MSELDWGSCVDVLEELRAKELEEATNIVQWGLWARGGLPECSSLERGTTPAITDDDALAIERVVAKLPVMTRTVIKRLYIGRYTLHEIAMKLMVSKRRVAEYRDQGLNIIHGAINFSKVC